MRLACFAQGFVGCVGERASDLFCSSPRLCPGAKLQLLISDVEVSNRYGRCRQLVQSASPPLGHTVVVDYSPPLGTNFRSIGDGTRVGDGELGGNRPTVTCLQLHYDRITSTSRTGAGHCVVPVPIYVVPILQQAPKGCQVYDKYSRALVRVRRAVPQRWRTRLAVSYHYQFQGIFSAGRAALGAVSMVDGRADGRMQGRERGQTRRWLAEEGAGRGSHLEGRERKGGMGWEGKCNSDITPE